QVARQHAVIERTPEGYRFRHLTDKGTSRLNGGPVSGVVPLPDGDRLELGQTLLIFRQRQRIEPSLPLPPVPHAAPHPPQPPPSHRGGPEVAGGGEAARRYPLEHGENAVGNALEGARGIDLAGQESSSPRRMAGRQASLTFSGESLIIRDLESPGGTFVNRQR